MTHLSGYEKIVIVLNRRMFDEKCIGLRPDGP